MTGWLDGAGRLFNPDPRVGAVPIAPGRDCVVGEQQPLHLRSLRPGPGRCRQLAPGCRCQELAGQFLRSTSANT